MAAQPAGHAANDTGSRTRQFVSQVFRDRLWRAVEHDIGTLELTGVQEDSREEKPTLGKLRKGADRIFNAHSACFEFNTSEQYVRLHGRLGNVGAK